MTSAQSYQRLVILSRPLVLAVALVLALVAVGTAAGRSSARCVVINNGTWYGTIAGNARTSCPFARNVANAVVRRIDLYGADFHGRIAVTAYSPVTGLTYRMRCFVDVGYDYVDADCFGGNNAEVNLHLVG